MFSSKIPIYSRSSFIVTKRLWHKFIGGKSELDDASKEELIKIEKWVTEQECRWLLNPPHASHFGGTWEQQIGTVRRVLDAMMLQLEPHQFTHELLTTFLAEVTAIVNARPIAPIPTEADELQPLTPAMLLTMKTKPLFPLPGVFVHHDLYSKRYWRRAQYLADQFWVRWRSEYLQTLQVRSKWNKRVPNLELHYIVLMKDESHRNQWPMGRVVETIKSKDNYVRKVKLMVIKDGVKKIYFRPLKDLVLLMRAKSNSEGDTSPNNNFSKTNGLERGVS